MRMDRSPLIDQINISLSKAYEFALSGNKDSALDLVKRILSYLSKLDVLVRLDILFKIIVLISTVGELEFYEKFLANEIRTIEDSIKDDITSLRYLARIKVEIAKFYAEKGKYPGDILDNALDLYKKLSQKEEYLIDLLSFLTAIYAEINKRFGFYSKAKIVLKEFIDKTSILTIEKLDETIAPYVSELLIALAELENLMENKKEAIDYLMRAVNIYLSINYFTEASNIAMILADLISDVTHIDRAIEFLQEFRRKIPDKDLINVISEKIKELRVRYLG